MTENERSSLLRDLVFEYLEGAEERPAHTVLDELCERHPDVARELRERIALLPASDDAGSPEPPVPTQIGSFELRGELGGGGMGVVHRAYDRGLDRFVALKIIRPGELLFEGARERFRREVEIIAGLKHPGIVPVYSSGEDQGVPWFTMELVEGCTLAEAVRDLRERREAGERLSGSLFGAVVTAAGADADSTSPPDGDSVLFHGPWPRVCAALAREVAEALEHAHRQGVLHRDVKPSNVMVTSDGRVMLLDFGLSSSEGAEQITRTGAALGSLAYMSPEQFDGDAERVGPASDVYSLGVTLYELLTLRLPHTGSSLMALRASVTEGRFPAPRTIDPSISWELDTIVRVALDPDPARRYVSAAAMAADLSAALEGRPIAARPPGTWRRVRLWAARRPAAAGLVALTALVIVGGPLLFGWQQRQSRLVTEGQSEVIEAQRNALADRNEELAASVTEERRQRDLAREEGARAQRNLARAIEAVDTMMTRVSEEDLSSVPGMELVRREMLERALAFFRELAKDQSGDPGLRKELALAWRRVGDIEGWLDRRGKALDALDRAEEILRQLIAEVGAGAELVREVAEVSSLRSLALRLKGQSAEARRVAKEALGLLDALPEDERNEPGTADARGELLLQLAEAYRGEGNREQTRAVLEKSLGALRTARVGREDELGPALKLGRAHRLLGTLATLDGPAGAPESAAQHRKTLEVLLPMEERFGNTVALRRDISCAEVNVGSALSMLGSEEAWEWIERGMQSSIALADDFPNSGTFAADAATAQLIFGIAHVAQGRDEEGLVILRAGIERLSAAREGASEDMDLLVRLAGARLQEGAICLQSMGQPAEAVSILGAAKELYDEAHAKVPTYGQVQMGRETTRQFLAYSNLEVGDPQAATSAAFEFADVANSPRSQVVAAAVLAQCAEALEETQGEVPEATGAKSMAERAKECDERAVELIESAVANGFDLANVTKDPSLEALVQREVTAALLEER